jgi:hypothetical protein
MATARILDSDHALLQELAARTGKQQQEILHEALANFSRDRMLDDMNAAFARLKKEDGAWSAELAERAEWDGASADGDARE